MTKTLGRPKKNLPEKEEELSRQVFELSAIQCTWKEIAIVLNEKDDYLQHHFSEEYRNGRENGKTRLRRVMFKAALAGNVTLMIWLSKQYLDMSDKQELTQDTTLEVKASGEEIVNAVKISLERRREPSSNTPVPL